MSYISFNKTFYKRFSKIKDKSEEQGQAVLSAVLKIAQNYEGIGLNKEKINNYWSYRVNDEMRIVSYISNNNTHLVYVGNHDDAYRYCSDTIPHLIGSKFIEIESDLKVSNQNRLNNVSSFPEFSFLTEYGFDEVLIDSLNKCKNEIELEKKVKYFSPEYRELILSRGKKNRIKIDYSSDVLVLNDDKELEKALKLSLPEWCLFLHPKQIAIRDYPINSKLIIKGGPGTGKSIALVWRYVQLYMESVYKKPLFVCRSKSTALVIRQLIKQIQPSINPTITSFPDDLSGKKKRNKFLSQFSHILIDEAQDLSVDDINYLLKSHHLNYTIAYDNNQRVLNLDSRRLLLKMENKSKIIFLNYCYRSTNQVIKLADSILRRFDDFMLNDVLFDTDTLEMDCPLEGNEVICLDFDTDEDLIKKLENLANENGFNLKSEFWCVIFSGFYRVEMLNTFKERFPGKVFDSEECKGNEFFNGFVIHYTNKQNGKNNQLNSTEFKKELFEPYVAITRFRDRCFYIRISQISLEIENIPQSKPFSSLEVMTRSYQCKNCKNVYEGTPFCSELDNHYCAPCWNQISYLRLERKKL
jgi:hypothetical protein